MYDGNPNTANDIVQFWHCGKCLDERPKGVSPQEYGQLEIGLTPMGLQVWCKRHDVNVLHITLSRDLLPEQQRCACCGEDFS